jgi:hypothetical protein
MAQERFELLLGVLGLGGLGRGEQGGSAQNSGQQNRKSDIRNPKSETSPTFEI